MSDDDKKEVSVSKEKKPARYVSPFDEMEQMMGQLFDRGGWMSPFHLRSSWPDFKPAFEGRTPKVDVIDRDKEVVVKAELPGVSKDDLEVTVSDDTLTIKASTKHEEVKEEGEYRHRELSTGEFVRTLRLPANVNTSDTVANFKDGLLELTLPKIEETKRRNIKIE
ncbi:Hsp20/alpha crystallin family protein [Pseudomonadota bacterium]